MAAGMLEQVLYGYWEVCACV